MGEELDAGPGGAGVGDAVEGEDFAHVAALADVDTLVTDSGVQPELADEIEAAGPRVVRA